MVLQLRGNDVVVTVDQIGIYVLLLQPASFALSIWQMDDALLCAETMLLNVLR